MTPEEHRDLVEAESRGQLLVGIDTAAARKFFTNVPHSKIQESIGEPVYVEKILILGSFVLGPVALVVAAISAGLALKWWSLLAVPAMLLVWLFYYARSSLAAKSILSAVVLLAVAVATAFVADVETPLKLSIILFGVALFLARFVYRSATFFLRALAMRNFRAFELLNGSAVIVREVH